MPFLCVGTSVVKEAEVVALVDLVLAILGIFFGLLALTYPDTIFNEWDIFSYRINPPEGSSLTDLIVVVSVLLLISIFILEILLYFVFTKAIKRLDETRLNLWYKIRFGFFVLSVILSVYRTIAMRDNAHDVVVLKGIGGIALLLYRGYALLVVTFLEELVVKQDVPTDRKNYYKL